MREPLRFTGKILSATVSREADRWFASLTNVRKDALHQLTTHLTRRFELIGIEDLNVRGMVKNRGLARSISDMGFFELRRQLEYKAKQQGGLIHIRA